MQATRTDPVYEIWIHTTAGDEFIKVYNHEIAQIIHDAIVKAGYNVKSKRP